MLILSYGVQKSGSTLAFELLRGTLMAAGFPQRRLPDGAVLPGRPINFVDMEGDAQRVVGQILGAIAAGEIAVVKTHGGFADEDRDYFAALIQANKLRIQVSQRDPRDICLSLLDAGARARAKGREIFSTVFTLEDARTAVLRNLPTLRKWQSLPNVLTLEYATLAFDSMAAVRQIEAFLGIRTNALAAIRYAFLDAFTQKNKAVRDRHKSELTREQTESLNALFREFLEEYGYA